jgi:hypothetical protein
MNPETECIEEEWNGFAAGTHREEIWEWFEETYGVRFDGIIGGNDYGKIYCRLL